MLKLGATELVRELGSERYLLYMVSLFSLQSIRFPDAIEGHCAA